MLNPTHLTTSQVDRCVEYTTDGPGHPFLNILRSLATLNAVQHDFSRLRTLRLNCNDTRITPVKAEHIEDWELHVRSNSTSHLALFNVKKAAGNPSGKDMMPVLLMFGALKRLKHLALALGSPGLEQVLLSCPFDHNPTLETLIPMEVNKSTSHKMGLAGAERYFSFGPSPLQLLWESEGHRSLAVEAAGLLTLSPASAENERAGEAIYNHSMTQSPGQLFDAHINLTLPCSLETLKMRVNNDERLQIAVRSLCSPPSTLAQERPRPISGPEEARGGAGFGRYGHGGARRKQPLTELGRSLPSQERPSHAKPWLFYITGVVWIG